MDSDEPNSLSSGSSIEAVYEFTQQMTGHLSILALSKV